VNQNLIIVADDHRVNLEAIKLDLESIGHLKRAEFYINGQEVVDRVLDFVGKAILSNESNMTLCPIQALILDFHMPIRNGIDTVKEVRKFYKWLSIKKDDLVLIEPIYIFLTTFGDI
jgi:CheY-like chemotaxis protein